MSNRMNNAINVHFLASASDTLQSLIGFQEHKFPYLEDPPLPRSFIIFFDFGSALEYLELPATEYDAYRPIIQELNDKLQCLRLEDNEPGAYRLACLVQSALHTRFDIVLPALFISTFAGRTKKGKPRDPTPGRLKNPQVPYDRHRRPSKVAFGMNGCRLSRCPIRLG